MRKYEVVMTDMMGRTLDFGVQADTVYEALQRAQEQMIERLTDYHIDAVTGIAIYEVA